jgi:exopolyphosphatase/pppGpp-phosphohydrolase
MNFQDRGKRVGLIEIGSRSVRYMVARFDQAGTFEIDPRAKDSFEHRINLDSMDDVKVSELWSKVGEFNDALLNIRCDRVWIYGTELCRRLEREPGQQLPSFVTILSAKQEAIAAWSAGFLSSRFKNPNQRYTIIDQGGGSAEFVTATWTGKTIAGYFHESLDDLGSLKLAELYAGNTDQYGRLIRPLLEKHDKQIKLHEAVAKTDELLLLGGAATKLAFNIKHKRHDEDDYRPHETDSTRLSVNEIAQYYYKMAKLFKEDPVAARYKMDRRTVKTNEYEVVMSGAIVLMLAAIRLGHQQVTVSVNSTRYGIGFMVARGIIK